jgi:hypothetical protein
MGKEKQKGYKSDVLGMEAINLGRTVPSTILYPKESKSSGQANFNGNGMVDIECGEASYKFQISMNITAIQTDGQSVSEEEKQEILAGQPLVSDKYLRGKTEEPQVFSTGSVGFHYGEKITLTVGKVTKQFQVGLNLIAHGSKDWDEQRPVERPETEQPSAE